MEWATNTPYEGYKKFCLLKDGVYQQLNTNILQIENEYYSTIRPKQPLLGNEKQIVALGKRGVRYVEIRSLGVRCLAPASISRVSRGQSSLNLKKFRPL